MSKLNVGDLVSWRGGFGVDAPKQVTVKSIEVCVEGRKEGRKVSSVEWSDVSSRKIVVDLDNGHWAYGTQLKEIKK